MFQQESSYSALCLKMVDQQLLLSRHCDWPRFTSLLELFHRSQM